MKSKQVEIQRPRKGSLFPPFLSSTIAAAALWFALCGTSLCASTDAAGFEPSLTLTAGTAVDSPTGLSASLDFAPEGEPGLELSAATLSLPSGLRLDPSGLAALQGCSPAQVGLTSAPGTTPAAFNDEPATCPLASRLGSLEVDSSATVNPLHGSIYLATPSENPFAATFALYAVLEESAASLRVKIPALLSPDYTSGQLTLSLPELPDLPMRSVGLEVPGSPEALLTTPPTCGAFNAEAELDPRTGEAFHVQGGFSISEGAGGGACASTESAEPDQPGFAAGTLNPDAGAFSPLSLHITRENGTQPLGGLDVTLPPGLLGRLAGIAICTDAQISQGAARAGEGGGGLEMDAPSCPATSQLGIVAVSSGAGEPLRSRGNVYLAGPYMGAPLSVVVITPAIAGPFDLGVVVDRVAIHVNPITAQIEPITDTVPTIQHGVPLDLRSIDIEINRSEFTFNPTNCNPLATVGSLTSALGKSIAVASAFQASGCASLAFHPKLTLKLKGSTRRTGNPALTAIIRTNSGEANTAAARVTLPPTEFVDNAHIGEVCTNVQFNAPPGNGANCPSRSIYGRARILTPLIAVPAEGVVYLRSNPEPGLPNLVIALHGPAEQPIAIDVVGKIDSAKDGGLRATFSAVPDAPYTRFELHMLGGRKGLLVNSKSLCARHVPKRALARLIGQNGTHYKASSRVRASCHGPPRNRHPRKPR